jgi:hypothetical protein
MNPLPLVYLTQTKQKVAVTAIFRRFFYTALRIDTQWQWLSLNSGHNTVTSNRAANRDGWLEGGL